MIEDEGNLGVTTYKCVIQKQLINCLINNRCHGDRFPGRQRRRLVLRFFCLINSLHSIVLMLSLCEGSVLAGREMGPPPFVSVWPWFSEAFLLCLVQVSDWVDSFFLFLFSFLSFFFFWEEVVQA